MATEQAASLPLLLLCRHSPRLSTPEAGPASAQRLEGCDSPRLTPSAEEGFQRGARGGGREGWVREELVEVAERVREEHLHRVRLSLPCSARRRRENRASLRCTFIPSKHDRCSHTHRRLMSM
eukprot:GHVU01124285.1.p1 GENE.GHVU01124285.1~~GHVU01124285.1.p1  ORF type:complete len:123 (+),score=12.94 GHVU01124285.1:625-993(+)